jgi:hypothetical protein
MFIRVELGNYFRRTQTEYELLSNEGPARPIDGRWTIEDSTRL